MIKRSETITSISKAMLQFQGTVEGVFKAAANPHFKSRYANLETVIDTARPALQKVGVMFTQSAGAIVDGCLEMTTLLVHAESGEWLESTMQIPLGKKDPQGAGSAQTYAQRYSLMAILGLPPTDDDAETAIDRDDKRPSVSEPQVDVKKAATLKKDGAWEAMVSEIDKAMSAGPSLVEFDTELKGYFWKKGKELGFNQSWMEELKSVLLGARADIEAATNTVDDIKNEFPGAKVSNERYISTLEAGE